MVTVSSITQKLIDDNILLQEAVSMGISNYTSLAKHLKVDVERIYGEKAKLSTIIRAIQRYAEKYHGKQKQLKFDFFKSIKLDSDVAYIVVQESQKALDKIQRLFYEMDFNKGAIFNVLQGNHEIAIITNRENKDLFLDVLSDEKITHIVEDHDSISLSYSKDYSFTPGLIYNISRNIAWKNINVLTMVHTPKELTLIVHENDATKCYNILHQMQNKISR